MIKNKKLLSILIILIALGLGAGGILYYRHNHPAKQQAAVSDENTTDLSPATPEDIDYSNSFKQPDTSSPGNGGSTTPPDNGGTTKKSVTPVIVDTNVYDGKFEARGYVSGVIEDGGTCKYTLTKDTTTILEQSPAVADATTTRCENLSVPSTLASGKWSAVLTYDSPTSTGTSASSSFEVK